jgi:hypothetical protein
MHIDRTEAKERLHFQSYERIKHSRKNSPLKIFSSCEGRRSLWTLKKKGEGKQRQCCGEEESETDDYIHTRSLFGAKIK